METILRLAAFLALMATPALAADWVTRPGDRLIDRAALTRTVSGKALLFYDDAQSVFSQDGKYSYTYSGGGTWFGHYIVNDNSTICVTFVTGVTRCDLYVRNAGRLILITESGLRFPIRP